MKKMKMRLVPVLMLCLLFVACAKGQTLPWEQALALVEDLEGYQLLIVDEPMLAAYRSQEGDETLCISKSAGYKEDVVVMIRFQAGTVDQVRVLWEEETEDYGGYIREDWFLERFQGLGADMELEIVKMAKKRENEIVAVTGATVSSRAVLQAVQVALDYMEGFKEGS